jgi:hypothetical protein
VELTGQVDLESMKSAGDQNLATRRNLPQYRCSLSCTGLSPRLLLGQLTPLARKLT